MKLDGIKLRGIHFKWGDNIKKIMGGLKSNEYFENDNPYSIEKTLRVKLTDAWGIPCNSWKFSSPHYDRMIDNLTINVANFGEDYEFIINRLEEQFGPRFSDYNGRNHGSGSVIKNCKWKFDNCDVGISIFGGKREDYGEINYGMIYFHFTDFKVFYDLYSLPWRNKALQLENDTKNKNIELSIFTMKEPQLASWASEHYHFPDLDKDYISNAFNSFHKRNLFTTPSEIKTRLAHNQVCIFLNPEDNAYYISNVWDTSSLKGVETVSWLNTLPARGGGMAWVSAGGLSITNDHSQPETEKLIGKLSKILNIEIDCQQDYNC